MRIQNRNIVLVAIAILAYLLPWLTGDSNGLRMGAYDLAEWLSIDPLNRATTPPLLWSLFLRLPPVFLAYVLIFQASVHPFSTRGGWMMRMMTLFLCLYSLPPLENLTEWRHDPNMIQQALLAISILLMGLLCFVFPRLSHSIRWPVGVMMYIAALLSGLLGVIYVQDTVGGLGLEMHISVGFVGFVFVLTLMIIDAVRNAKSESQQHGFAFLKSVS